MAVILVTGGAGYIGSHACKALAEAGHEPVTYDNLKNGWRDAVKFGPLEEGDLLDTDRVIEVMRAYKPDAVMHFAALIEVGVSVHEPDSFWKNNVSGTVSLLDAMVETGVRKIVFSSTCAVNGDQDGVMLDETSGFAPASPYATSKFAVEHMLHDYGIAFGIRHLAFRYFNVAGADDQAKIGEHHRPETHLIPLILDAIEGKRDALSVFGQDYPTRDGTCVRDYVHVEDLADAHVMGLDYLDRDERVPVLTLGTGDGFTVREVMEAAAEVTGKPVPAVDAPRRAGDPASLICGSKMAGRELGWSPERSTLKRMIGDAYRWHQTGHYTK